MKLLKAFDETSISESAVRIETSITSLRLSEAQWGRIRSELLKPCGREHHLFAILGRSGDALTVHRLMVPSEEDYEVCSPHYVALSQAFVLQVLRAYEGMGGAGLLDLHSHPFQEKAAFSSTDLAFYGRMLAHVLERVPGGTFMAGVLGTAEEGFLLEAHSAFAAGSDVRGILPQSGSLVPEIEVVGRTGTRSIRSWRAPASSADDIPNPEGWFNAYERNAQIRTPEENDRVASARVAIVGAGGIGSEMARLIALLGVRDIALIDADNVEPRNLNRLLWASAEDEGRPKVDCLAETLQRHDPVRKVHAIATPFPSPEAVHALERADLVLVGVDSDRARFDVLRLCVRHLRPAVDAGTAIFLDEAGSRERLRAGHIWTYLPGEHRCWLDMGLDGPGLWDPGLLEARRQAGYVIDVDSGAAAGSVQTLNALVASLAVQAAEQLLKGRDPGPEMVQVSIDIAGPMKTRVRAMRIAGEPGCPLCGTNGFEGEGGNPFVDGAAASKVDNDITDLPALPESGPPIERRSGAKA